MVAPQTDGIKPDPVGGPVGGPRRGHNLIDDLRWDMNIAQRRSEIAWSGRDDGPPPRRRGRRRRVRSPAKALATRVSGPGRRRLLAAPRRRARLHPTEGCAAAVERARIQVTAALLGGQVGQPRRLSQDRQLSKGYLPREAGE
jgi:hypothetical protein